MTTEAPERRQAPHFEHTAILTEVEESLGNQPTDKVGDVVSWHEPQRGIEEVRIVVGKGEIKERVAPIESVKGRGEAVHTIHGAHRELGRVRRVMGEDGKTTIAHITDVYVAYNPGKQNLEVIKLPDKRYKPVRKRLRTQ